MAIAAIEDYPLGMARLWNTLLLNIVLRIKNLICQGET